MKIFDLHNDLPTLGLTMGTSEREREKLYRSYVPHRVVSVFWTSLLKENALPFIKTHIEKHRLENRLYAVEDLDFIRDETILSAVASLPLLYAGLTWNGENYMGGGAGCETGLTEFGKAVVKELCKNSIIPDSAHLSTKSFYDMSENCNILINSHTCLKSIFDHPRNLSDEQIQLILARGGIVGLTLVAQFMGRPEKQGERKDYVRQVDTFAQKFGIGGLCIGTDFNGTDPILGLGSYGEFEDLKADLSKLGYTQDNIERIFYHNADGFFKNYRVSAD